MNSLGKAVSLFSMTMTKKKAAYRNYIDYLDSISKLSLSKKYNNKLGR